MNANERELMENRGYPVSPVERNRWVLERRGEKNRLDPLVPYAHLWEEEFGGGGGLVSTITLFLTNRECPFRCLMCDLWKDTLDKRVPTGAIPQQIDYALERLPAARQIKLYNAGSFFDPQAIPPEDYMEIAKRVSGFERVIVECHPAFLGERCRQFRAMLPGQLEVAIGLETAHSVALERLNKRITVDSFRRAADFLAQDDISLRVFLLVRPPFLSEAEGVEWAKRSLDIAFDCGASACCLIPTRGGNGAMEALAATGDYAPPALRSVEQAQEYGLNLHKGRVFADTWDIEQFFTCACSPARAARLAQMNATQRLPEAIHCLKCL